MTDAAERLKNDLQGRYEVGEEIGRGGMGVVYLGRDVGLDRRVAIKVLPDHLAQDPERLARFEREAKILATLNHPNIAGIHGIEHVDGRHYLILEYVEGESLADRLARSSLSIKEAMTICRDIAAGVDAAHEKGVVHRDLKPGNVRISTDDEIKVLDFGLAKGAIREESSAAQLESPTLTFQQATREGVILGTTSYLSPEQARGKPVNRRTDIWAFGCVLYECLTGSKAFEGETASDTIAKILERELDFAELPPSTPPRLVELLQRCLEKEEKKRLRDIGDAKLEIEKILTGGDTASSVGGEESWIRNVVPVSTRRGWMRATVFTGVGAVLASTVWILLGIANPSSRQADTSIKRFSIEMPQDLTVLDHGLSPDGGAVVIRAREKAVDESGESKVRMYVRQLDDFEFRPLPGTEGVSGGRLSTDGKWLAFVAPINERSTQRRVSRVPIDGSSPPVAIADWKEEWSTVAWLGNGDFLVTTNSSRSYIRISSASGEIGEALPFIEGDTGHSFRFLDVLPEDRGVLLSTVSWQEAGYQVSIAVLDLESGETRILLNRGGHPGYSRTGHLVFSRGENLLAVPFDLKSLTISGEPTALMQGLRTDAIWDNGEFELSDDGTLLYAPGGMVGGKRSVAVLTTGGDPRVLSQDTYAFEETPSVSADGRMFASVVANPNGIYEVWGGDPARGRLRKLAVAPSADCSDPVLSHDGRFVAYQRFGRNDEDGIYVRRTDGTGSPRKVIHPESIDYYYQPTGWSRDGQWLFVNRFVAGKGDVVACDVTNESDELPAVREILATSETEFNATPSPDGHLLAYESDETGQHELYVCPIDSNLETGLPVNVSNGEGHRPRWSPEGNTLYFNAGPRGFLAVEISASPSITLSDPVSVASAEKQEAFDQRYAPLPGDRVLVVLRGDAEDNFETLHLVLNWDTELSDLMSQRVARGP